MAAFAVVTLIAIPQVENSLTIRNTDFEINGKPFEFTDVSFFNALFYAEFN